MKYGAVGNGPGSSTGESRWIARRWPPLEPSRTTRTVSTGPSSRRRRCARRNTRGYIGPQDTAAGRVGGRRAELGQAAVLVERVAGQTDTPSTISTSASNRHPPTTGLRHRARVRARHATSYRPRRTSDALRDHRARSTATRARDSRLRRQAHLLLEPVRHTRASGRHHGPVKPTLARPPRSGSPEGPRPT